MQPLGEPPKGFLNQRTLYIPGSPFAQLALIRFRGPTGEKDFPVATNSLALLHLLPKHLYIHAVLHMILSCGLFLDLSSVRHFFSMGCRLLNPKP